jgi:hypothetical protein
MGVAGESTQEGERDLRENILTGTKWTPTESVGLEVDLREGLLIGTKWTLAAWERTGMMDADEHCRGADGR